MSNKSNYTSKKSEFISNEQRFLYTSFMNAPAGIAIIKGPTHIYEFANTEYNKIVNREIAIGKTVYDNLPEIEQQGIIAILNEVFATGEPFVANEYPIELRQKSSGTLELGYYNIVIQPMKSEVENIEGLLIHALEVSQQVKARHQIEASEKRFSNILSQSIMAIAILKGPEMIINFANDKILEAWDKGINVIGKSFLEVLPELKNQEFLSLLENVYRTGVPYYGYESEVIMVRDSKEQTFYYNFVYEPYTEVDDTISGITMLATDVTQHVLAKKQIEASETFNRSILQSSPDCLKVLDSRGRIQFINGNGLCQMEIDAFSDIQNKMWSSLWGVDNEEVINAAVDKALTGKTSHFTVMCYTKKGTAKWWDVKVSPVGKAGEQINQIISVSRDITDQKSAQEEIKNLATHLKLATDSANAGTWSLNIKQQKLEWSALHKKLWGYDENHADLKYQDWHIPIIPEDRAHAFAMVEESRINKSIYQADYRIKRASDGALRYMRSYGKYSYDGNGEAETLTGISIDLTQEKLAEEKLRESEKQFRIFADSIQNLAFIADGNGVINWYNQRWYDYTGTTAQETDGLGWKKAHHPDHSKNVLSAIEKLRKKGEAWELSFPLRKHDGTYRWFLTRAYPVKDANCSIERWIGTCLDITEQKNFTEALENKVQERTEELYAKNQSFELAEKIAQFGSYRWNVASGLLVYSDNLFRLLDCEPQEFEPSFEKFITFVHPDDLLQVLADAEQTIETGQSLSTPYRIITKTGTVKYVSTIGNYTGEGENRTYVGVFQDLTNSINNAESLRSKNHELENLNAELKSFAFIASHDLQEPLRKIQMFSKRILELETFSDETENYFNRITTASARMQKLVISLLDFSSINTTEINSKSCDLNVIIEESKNDLNLLITEHQATIITDNLPTIKGQPIQLTQLFTNLIGNAIKYSKSEVKPIVEISTMVVHGAEIEHLAANIQQKYLIVIISDNGIGFEQQYSIKIFEPFKRLHNKDTFSGTGIGLAIVKKIVSNHSGFITAEGEVGKGSTFKVYLPI
jgi:PAS domain S-box-containing protein